MTGSAQSPPSVGCYIDKWPAATPRTSLFQHPSYAQHDQQVLSHPRPNTRGQQAQRPPVPGQISSYTSESTMYHDANKPSHPKTTHPVLSVLGHPLSLQPVPVPADGIFGDWGVRAGARESPGLPLGWPPSQGPPRRVVPDDAAALWSRASLAAPTGAVLKEGLKRKKQGGGGVGEDELEGAVALRKLYAHTPEHRSAPRPPASAILQNDMPLRSPQQSANLV